MFMKLLVVCMMVISPIWPLGKNPLIGDPYIIVNKSTNEMAFIADGQVVKVYEVATGSLATLTPEGEYNIVVKAINPYYRKKDIAGGSKENPLGTRWIGFDAEQTDGRIYGIHGTNDSSTIGGYITGGCVRMYNEDVEELFTKVPLGTKVFITKASTDFNSIAIEKGVISE